jgi:molecular chaperone DnaK (HSP70)
MIIKVPELLDYVTLKFKLERTLFEEKAEHLFARVAAPAQEALKKAGLKASDID